MLDRVQSSGLQPIDRGYNSVFRLNRIGLGLVAPLEAYNHGPVPSMSRHAERVQLAERLGFPALWLRDMPFNVPSFGDAGQLYDPFVYLALLAGQTERIALGVAIIVLPLLITGGSQQHPDWIARHGMAG
jgi:alkanesulfonate monooxygenase SsuD/methylene tetrahydromethanopterin reductase-like flavin-dependent oxidoreductase (luciferase family)